MIGWPVAVLAFIGGFYVGMCVVGLFVFREKRRK